MTNLDYVIEDFLNKRLMLVEEKQNCGEIHTAQKLTMQVLDKALGIACPLVGYKYLGLYVLRLKATMPGPGMTLNGNAITCEQLVAHLNFEKGHCPPFFSLPKEAGT